MLIVTATLFIIHAQADDTAKLRKALFQGVNELRAEGKASLPLARNAKLDAAAQKHAENMARQDKYGDDSKTGHVLDGKGRVERMKAEGHPGIGIFEIAELIFDPRGGDVNGEIAVVRVVKD
jgi:uncharacterized protein YkwD